MKTLFVLLYNIIFIRNIHKKAKEKERLKNKTVFLDYLKTMKNDLGNCVMTVTICRLPLPRDTSNSVIP